MAKDLFSQQASIYALYRPAYPAELFDYILSFVTHRNTAWDCATGNGQSALSLAPFFETVYATDISEKQLQQAPAHPHIQYSMAPAEKTPFADHQFDLVTVAQAYHWFNFTAFHQEVLRVAKPGAVIAIWGYSLLVSKEALLNELIQQFYTQTVGPFWDAERRYIDDAYTTVPFPYQELPARTFTIPVTWTKEALTGYLNTWSSVQHFIKANGYNPVTALAANIKQLWPDETSKSFHFPLFLRIGRT